jgi:hypothetical protein
MPAVFDPLAVLRQQRGWIEQVDETVLGDTLRQVRWLEGLCYPACGETNPRYLEVMDEHYQDRMYRYRCLVCALVGGADGINIKLTKAG